MFGRKKDGSEYSDIIEQNANIPAGGDEKVLFRGSEWLSYPSSSEDIEKGSTVKIEGNHGIKLKVSSVKK